MKSMVKSLLTGQLVLKVIQENKTNQSCHIGVDLTLMMPRGGNGGIKPAILTFLQSLKERFPDTVRLSLLVNSSTYREVDFFVGHGDRVVCVALTHGSPWPIPDSKHPYLSVCPSFAPANLRELGIDVFYCPFGPTNRSTSTIPTIALVTDLLHRDYPFSVLEQERIWREEYFRNILADADYVQCISQYTVDRLLRCYQVRKDRVFFTHLPIDQRLQVGLGGPPDRAYFIYPANFWIHKNHEVLLIAYRIYRETTTNPWDLLLTGNMDGNMKERARQIQDLAGLLRIKDNVRFAGYVDDSVFSQLLGGAAALIYPSLHEGFGIPLIEAMRFRKPIICGKSASVLEVAGDAALSVDEKKPLELAAAMIKLTGNSAVRAQLVAKGVERLRMFSIEVEINKLHAVFITAMRSNSATAKVFRIIRRSRKWGRYMDRTWRMMSLPAFKKSAIGECLLGAHACFHSAKAKALRLARRSHEAKRS
jgi:glycosyltransferase involved in cell wall biosynthesis